MTSTFRGAVAAAALAAAICVAPSSASASVELQDYSFSSSVELYIGVSQPLYGTFTLAHDNVTDDYDLNAINFQMFGHAFTTANTSVYADIGSIHLSGFDGSSEDFAQFTLSFEKSPILFSDISVAFGGCTSPTEEGEFGTCYGENTGASTGTVERLGGAVPEPATWALMIGGFGLAGATLRRRRAAMAAA